MPLLHRVCRHLPCEALSPGDGPLELTLCLVKQVVDMKATSTWHHEGTGTSRRASQACPAVFTPGSKTSFGGLCMVTVTFCKACRYLWNCCPRASWRGRDIICSAPLLDSPLERERPSKVKLIRSWLLRWHEQLSGPHFGPSLAHSTFSPRRTLALWAFLHHWCEVCWSLELVAGIL